MSQEFGSTVDEFAPSTKFRKTEFLKLEEGEYRIRLLEKQETKHYTHYLGFAYVACLGEDCPVCENNKRILYEHPQDYKTQKGWSPKSQRFYINVLDKTTDEHTVKVFSMSKGLLEDLKVLARSVRNEQDEMVDIRTYDFTLNVKGIRQNKEVRVAHKWYPGKENLENVKEDALFDLSNATVKLTGEEMMDVLNGTSLKDIFAVRRATREALKVSPEAVSNPLVDASVDEIFKIN